MQFTIEFEQNCEIPFLEVLVKRKQNNSFSTSIYRKKQPLAFTLNATPLHLVSTRLISSAHFLIVVFTSVHQPLYYSLLLMIWGIFCPVMATSRVSLLRTWIMFWTVIPSLRSPEKQYSLFFLTLVCRINLPHTKDRHTSAIADHFFSIRHNIKSDHFEIFTTGKSDIHYGILLQT